MHWRRRWWCRWWCWWWRWQWRATYSSLPCRRAGCDWSETLLLLRAEDPEDRGGSDNSTCFRWIGLVLITRFCELLMCFILNTPSNVIDIEHTRATVCCEQSWYDEKILLKGDAADISLNVFHLKKVFFVRDLLTVVLSGEQIQITFTQRDFLSRLLKPWVQRQMEKNDFSGKNITLNIFERALLLFCQIFKMAIFFLLSSYSFRMCCSKLGVYFWKV